MTGPDGPTPRRAVRPLGPIVAGLLSLLIYLSLVGLPLIGVVVAPLSAIPVLSIRLAGRPPVLAWGWPALLLAVAAYVGGPSAVVLLAGYLLLVALPATTAEAWERAGWSEALWAEVSTAIALVVALLLVAALAWPAPPHEATARWLAEAAERAQAFYGEMGMDRARMSLLLDWWQVSFAWILPSAVVAYVVLALFWLRPRLPLVGFGVGAGPFERYGNDEWVPAAFALGGAGTMLLGGTARWVAANLLGAALILCFVHGLAIIRAHLGRLVGRGWLVRWAVALVAIQMPIALLVAALGLIDPFRRLRPAIPEDHGRLE